MATVLLVDCDNVDGYGHVPVGMLSLAVTCPCAQPIEHVQRIHGGKERSTGCLQDTRKLNGGDYSATDIAHFVDQSCTLELTGS